MFSCSGRGAIRLTLGYARQLVTPRDTRLRRAGDLIRITILDPIILGDGRTVSVADQGGHREAIIPQRCL